MEDARSHAGRLFAVSGSVARAETEIPLALGEVVRVGRLELSGEVIALEGKTAVLQIFEETSGLSPGDAVISTGEPLMAELGPGLLGRVFDGLLRPLEELAESQGDFLGRGLRAATLDPEKLWQFRPSVRVGDMVTGGSVLGTVEETAALEHRILLPPALSGKVVEVREEGPGKAGGTVALIEAPDGRRYPATMRQTWPVRSPRPCRRRLAADTPLVTGQRVLDTFFPIARGGAAGMPGGFGTGKTVLQNQLCRWAHADVIVFVGCGERGNEMTRLLRELPSLPDPRTGHRMAERTVIVANTSNMPVSAREASLCAGVTVAEYFRDMGYHVALLADSTSRWAEALREISGRLEEMPAEEGYPPYLASRLAEFYGRAGRVETLGGTEGSVSIISTVSPAGGDLTEPVTRHTQNFARCFWTLDKTLAEARFFPAVSIRDSYSDLPEGIPSWWGREVSQEWRDLRQRALALLAEAEEVETTARLVGSEGLPPRQRLLLQIRALLEEGFLLQNAFDPADAYCSPARQFRLLRVLLRFSDAGLDAVERGVSDRSIAELPVVGALRRASGEIGDAQMSLFGGLEDRIREEMTSLEAAAGEAVGR